MGKGLAVSCYLRRFRRKDRQPDILCPQVAVEIKIPVRCGTENLRPALDPVPGDQGIRIGIQNRPQPRAVKPHGVAVQPAGGGDLRIGKHLSCEGDIFARQSICRNAAVYVLQPAEQKAEGEPRKEEKGRGAPFMR